jgi:hypothetical protein
LVGGTGILEAIRGGDALSMTRALPRTAEYGKLKIEKRIWDKQIKINQQTNKNKKTAFFKIGKQVKTHPAVNVSTEQSGPLKPTSQIQIVSLTHSPRPLQLKSRPQ